MPDRARNRGGQSQMKEVTNVVGDESGNSALTSRTASALLGDGPKNPTLATPAREAKRIRQHAAPMTPGIDESKHLSFANQLLSPTRLNYQAPASSFNIWNHLTREMFGWGEPGSLKPPGKENIMNFLVVPYELECFLFLGLLMCLDAFLYVLTFLPLRVVLALCSLVQEIPLSLLNVILGEQLCQRLRIFPRFHRTQGFDLMRGAMLFTSVLVLQRINMSQVYHFIRGQSIIKLYVLMGMMEVLDKLLCSFGQDVFDALHNATRRNPTSRYTALYFTITLAYVSFHAVFYFYQVATYMVVVNSADEALVTVLVLNNFSELRGFVFKKFDANNLFQCACSDISERFQILLFLSIIVMVTIAQQTTPTTSFTATWQLFWQTLLNSTSSTSSMSASTVASASSTGSSGTSQDAASSVLSAVASTVLSNISAQTMQSGSQSSHNHGHQSSNNKFTANSTLVASLFAMQRCMVYMVVGESLSDCIKHAFMNKFNSINASIYRDFAYILRSDLLNVKCDTIVLDHTYIVTRRLGLAQIPLAAVVLRYVILAGSRMLMVAQALSPTTSAAATTAASSAATASAVLGITKGSYVYERIATWFTSLASLLRSEILYPTLVIWVVLCLVKILLGIGLVVYAHDRQERDTALFYSRTPLEQDRLSLASSTSSDDLSLASTTVNVATSASYANIHDLLQQQQQQQQQQQIHQQQELLQSTHKRKMSSASDYPPQMMRQPLGLGKNNGEDMMTAREHSASDWIFSPHSISPASGNYALTHTPTHKDNHRNERDSSQNQQRSSSDMDILPSSSTATASESAKNDERTEVQEEEMIAGLEVVDARGVVSEVEDDADEEEGDSLTGDPLSYSYPHSLLHTSYQQQQEQEQQQKQKDTQKRALARIDFMEKLASMERYTVYNGRII